MRTWCSVILAVSALLGTADVGRSGGGKNDWVMLFNGKDTSGWVLRNPKTTSGWTVENGELVCSKPHAGNDLLTEGKFRDFELYIEFQATSNSGVYLQGLYEIQIINSFGKEPKLVEKNGKKVATLDTHQCGAIYGRIAPSKNVAKPPKEWQSYHVFFHGARGSAGKATKKARVTLIWNGEKVIDDAEIDGPTGSALNAPTTEPGPILLQGDHGRVAFRNIKIKPSTSTK